MTLVDLPRGTRPGNWSIGTSITRLPYPSVSPHRITPLHGGAGMLTWVIHQLRLLGLTLGPALSTLSGLTFLRKPRLSATRVLIAFIATYAGRVSSVAFSRGLRSTFTTTECSPTK